METHFIRRDSRWAATGPALLAAVLLAGCPQSVPGGGGAGPDAAVSTPTPEPDADTGPEIAGLEIVPNDFTMFVGQTRQLEIQLVDENDDVVPSEDGPVTWSSSNDHAATVSGGLVEAVAPTDNVVITASQGTFSGTAHIEILGFDDCCQAAVDLELDNLCEIPADNASCSIAAPNGPCDTDGDGQISDGERDAGAEMFTAQCTGGSGWQPELACQAEAPHNTEPCDDIYDPTIDYWRCVEWENTDDWPGSPIYASQVCRDHGDGPLWLTMNLSPRACCECHGQVRDRGDIPIECCASGIDCTVPTQASAIFFE